jgi:chromosome partitioning protein
MTESAVNIVPRPKIVSVANQKGGVGKTTTSVNLAASLAHTHRKTLLIDLDPQGNASGGLGVDRYSSSTIYDVLIGRKDLGECIQPTALDDLFIIPSNQNLIGAEVELINAISREKKLKSALKKLPSDFDFVIFDCPPSLGLLTINAFTASHSLLIPTQCEYYAMEGLGQLLSTYQIVKEDLNEDLDIEGVLLTMFDPRNKLTHEVVKEMRAHFPDKLYETVIPRNVKLSESPSFGKPVILYDPESKGAHAYLALAEEFLKRNGLWTEPQKDICVVEGPPCSPEIVVAEAKEDNALRQESALPIDAPELLAQEDRAVVDEPKKAAEPVEVVADTLEQGSQAIEGSTPQTEVLV